MKLEMFSVNVRMPDTIFLPGGNILRSFANIYIYIYKWPNTFENGNNVMIHPISSIIITV